MLQYGTRPVFCVTDMTQPGTRPVWKAGYDPGHAVPEADALPLSHRTTSTLPYATKVNHHPFCHTALGEEGERGRGGGGGGGGPLIPHYPIPHHPVPNPVTAFHLPPPFHHPPLPYHPPPSLSPHPLPALCYGGPKARSRFIGPDSCKWWSGKRTRPRTGR